MIDIDNMLITDILGKAHVIGKKPAEKDCVKKLMDIVQFMSNGTPKSKSPQQLPQMSYKIFDSQNVSIDKSTSTSNSKLRPDVAFVFNNETEATFGNVFLFLEAKGQIPGPKLARKSFSQLADYALALWEYQPTRKFIPILYLQR